MTTSHVQKPAHQFYDGFDTLWYGYGLDIAYHGGRKMYQHCGGTSGYQAKLCYDPHTNITIINVANVNEDAPEIFQFTNVLRLTLTCISK